eukprot:scaffold67107_cov36-Prasinocladus_malaysianus.AAC.2
MQYERVYGELTLLETFASLNSLARSAEVAKNVLVASGMSSTRILRTHAEHLALPCHTAASIAARPSCTSAVCRALPVREPLSEVSEAHELPEASPLALDRAARG